MLHYILIIIAFSLFFLYDFNQIKLHKSWLQPTFFIGCSILALSVIHVILQEWNKDVNYLYLLFSMLFFCGLIYVLFFALPFYETYVEESSSKVCRIGIYALCRHPGFWMMLGFFLCLSLTFPTKHMLLVSFLCNLCNFLYILFQDKITFPCEFIDYHEYQKEVPFLMFTKQSIMTCRKTWR